MICKTHNIPMTRRYVGHGKDIDICEQCERETLARFTENMPVAPGQERLGSARDAMVARQERAAGTAGAGVSPPVHNAERTRSERQT